MNPTSESSGLESNILSQRRNALQVRFLVSNHSTPYSASYSASYSKSYSTPYSTKYSREIEINGVAIFQIMLIVTQTHSVYNNLLFIRFLKTRKEDELIYTIEVSCKDLGIAEKTFRADDGTWHLINENKNQQYTIDMNLVLHSEHTSSFAVLYDDTELMDFELRGEDGSVQVHRAVLAASSPVLRSMLSGSWRESAEGHVDVPGISRKTLQHLKDFMYLHTLPETGIEQLLLLASYYMMPGLEQLCVDKLACSVAPENVCGLLQFAVKHQLTRLMLAVLESLQNGTIRVHEIREHYLSTKVK